MRQRWAAIPGTLAAIALTLAACVTTRPQLLVAPVKAGPSVAIQAAPVMLDASDPGRTSAGDFTYAGGIAVTSNETSRLHGLSDLVVGADGDLLSVSDDGADLFTGRLVLDAAGRLVGLTDGALRPLGGLDGQPLQGKAWTDAEGVTRLGNGEMLISFEREHRIWRYAPSTNRPPRPVAMPPVAMAENDGMEGLAAAPTVAADAYWVGVEPGSIWFCRLSVSCEEKAGLPTPPPGYRLSSLTTGPKGELVILHHSYIPAIGSRIIVSIVRDPLGARQVVDTLTLAPPMTVDNFEGVAVVARPDGGWRLYLLSDDNFSASQRTLLLAFDWTPPR
ncbi:MAG: esterase-like activity of phytase family protein [Caulobacter sp.]|nr:esterase-like activity of phytase family protein [Caulobacter sp.]